MTPVHPRQGEGVAEAVEGVNTRLTVLGSASPARAGSDGRAVGVFASTEHP